jgi:hypothetical protein
MKTAICAINSTWRFSTRIFPGAKADANLIRETGALGERGPGLIGGIAAGRPLLAALVLSFGAAALAAVGYQQSHLSFANASAAFLAALAIIVLAPASIAAIAPKNFWLRALYAGLAAGVILALRRLMLQTGFTISPFDERIALAVSAACVFVLALGAPLWRAAVGLSLIGLCASILGATTGLSVVALETGAGDLPTAGASLALAAAFGAVLSIQISAAFSRAFAEGGDNFSAAAEAARSAAAPALFSLGIGVFAIAISAFGAGAGLQAILASARVAASSIAFSLAAPLFMLAGALSLKGKTEMTAVIENRRRAALRPFLSLVRAILPPSSALAFTAIFLVAAIVAAFEAKTPASVAEIASVSAVAVIAAIAFVSLRTALMATLLFAAAGRVAAWGFDLTGVAPPTEIARVVASALAAALSMQLFLAWRDRRNPRRKTREVVQMALADSLFAYVAATALAVAALAASEAAGLWSEGVETALYAAVLATIGLAAAPPLMTAIGALFGRD